MCHFLVCSGSCTTPFISRIRWLSSSTLRQCTMCGSCSRSLPKKKLCTDLSKTRFFFFFFLMFYYVFSREVRLGEFLLHLEEKLKRYVGFSGVTSIPSSLRPASKRSVPHQWVNSSVPSFKYCSKPNKKMKIQIRTTRCLNSEESHQKNGQLYRYG